MSNRKLSPGQIEFLMKFKLEYLQHISCSGDLRNVGPWCITQSRYSHNSKASKKVLGWEDQSSLDLNFFLSLLFRYHFRLYFFRFSLLSYSGFFSLQRLLAFLCNIRPKSVNIRSLCFLIFPVAIKVFLWHAVWVVRVRAWLVWVSHGSL